jgi:hypothetical protein
VVVHIGSVGWDAQRVALTLRAGCPDTLAVFLPPSPTSLFGTEPQAGRWAVRGCARGG